MNSINRQDLIASYCFRSHARLHSLMVKEYAEIWFLLFESRVVDSKKNIKNHELYKESKDFLRNLVQDCESKGLALTDYDKQILDLAIYYGKEAIKKVKLSSSELNFWNTQIQKLEAIASSI